MKNPFSAVSRRLRSGQGRSEGTSTGDPAQDPETPGAGRSTAKEPFGFGSWRQRRVVERADEEDAATSDENQMGREDWSDVEEAPEPVAARSFSGRTVLLLLIVLALVVPLAPTVHRYFAQQAKINSLEQQISGLKDEQKDLKDQKDRWNDDDYVRQQARERLSYVSPGETPYIVTGKDKTSDQADDSSAEAVISSPPSWGENLWSSLSQSAE